MQNFIERFAEMNILELEKLLLFVLPVLLIAVLFTLWILLLVRYVKRKKEFRNEANL